MLDSKYIDAATLDEDVFRDVLFLSLAEGGAMGVPGEIIVVNKTPAAYNMNFVFGDVKIDDVISLFPALGECHFGLFGLDSTVPEGWNYVNLYMGNHLIVADEVYEEFQRLTKDCKEIGECYNAWQDAAKEIVGL